MFRFVPRSLIPKNRFPEAGNKQWDKWAKDSARLPVGPGSLSVVIRILCYARVSFTQTHPRRHTGTKNRSQKGYGDCCYQRPLVASRTGWRTERRRKGVRATESSRPWTECEVLYNDSRLRWRVLGCHKHLCSLRFTHYFTKLSTNRPLGQRSHDELRNVWTGLGLDAPWTSWRILFN